MARNAESAHRLFRIGRFETINDVRPRTQTSENQHRHIPSNGLWRNDEYVCFYTRADRRRLSRR